ncbi:MAG: XdhC family protein [Flavobacteriales bacterium]|nr:XdhC family protein [Flavobacteriales bacterium]
MNDLYSIITSLDLQKLPAAYCLIVSVKGSTPRREGAKMLVYADGSICGSIGGGALENQVIKDALRVIQQKKPQLFRHDLLHQHNMCCGGTVQIYIEPIMTKPKLYLFGAGHTGQAISARAAGCGFDTYIIDDRPEYTQQISTPDVQVMTLPFPQALKALPFDNKTFIAILTYNHAIDRDILFHCVKQPHAYLGMIGSQRKVEVTRKMMLESGLTTEEEINKINMPMGLDIHAETPEEIAISILAKLIQVKNSQL